MLRHLLAEKTGYGDRTVIDSLVFLSFLVNWCHMCLSPIQFGLPTIIRLQLSKQTFTNTVSK